METRSSRNSVILVSILAAFLPPFMASSITVALPTIGREFTMPPVALSWVITSYFLAIAAFLIPFGKAGDLYGRRNIFLCGAVLYTAASLLAGCAAGSTTLIATRVLQGIGGSMILSTGLAMLTQAAAPRERGAMLGLSVAATYIGLSLGPVLGGLLTQSLGWRSIFFVNVPLGLAIACVVLWKIRPERNVAPYTGFDFRGSVEYTVSLVALMYGLSQLPLSRGIALVTAGALGLFLFWRRETRIPSPVLDVRLFKRNKVFILSNGAALLSYSATTGAVFLISLYLQYIKGLSPRNAGVVLLGQPLVMALFSPFAGRLSDRIEPRIVASAGMAMTVVSLFFFSRLTEVSPMHHLVGGLMLLGAGIAFFSSPNTSAIMGSADRTQYGAAAAVVGTMRLTGSIISLSIAAVVLASYIGNVPVTPERHRLFITGVRISFLVFAALCAFGVFASLARGRVRGGSDALSGKEVLIE